jgi:hypothetical protein
MSSDPLQAPLTSHWLPCATCVWMHAHSDLYGKGKVKPTALLWCSADSLSVPPRNPWPASARDSDNLGRKKAFEPMAQHVCLVLTMRDGFEVRDLVSPSEVGRLASWFTQQGRLAHPHCEV